MLNCMIYLGFILTLLSMKIVLHKSPFNKYLHMTDCSIYILYEWLGEINKLCRVSTKPFIHLGHILKTHCVPGTVLGYGAITANKRWRICIFHSVALWGWEYAGETWNWKDVTGKCLVLRWQDRPYGRSRRWFCYREAWSIVLLSHEWLHHVPLAAQFLLPCSIAAILSLALPVSFVHHSCLWYLLDFPLWLRCLPKLCLSFDTWYFHVYVEGKEWKERKRKREKSSLSILR